MNVPRFSIIIPARNAATHLPATLASIRKQRFAPLEIILMDGASEDGTAELARSFPGLEIHVESAPDQGQLHALQKGARIARGDILYWQNADDVLLPGSLAEVDRAFRADSSLDLVYSDNFGFDETRRRLVNGGLIKGLSFVDHSLYYRQLYSDCVFWKRERTRFLPESDYDLRICTDYAFFLNMRRGLKTRWLDKRLGAFRIREGQISQHFLGQFDAEFNRIREGAYAQMGWSATSIPLRKALHWPSFTLRQRLRPSMAAALRAARRAMDGGKKRREMTDAFFDRWLAPELDATDELIRLLWR